MWPFGKSIAQRAQEAIDSMNVFQGLGLRVSEQNGVLSVSGAVPNKNYLRAIEAAVGGIKGIQSVDQRGDRGPAGGLRRRHRPGRRTVSYTPLTLTTIPLV